jgi:hypothetical protein
LSLSADWSPETTDARFPPRHPLRLVEVLAAGNDLFRSIVRAAASWPECGAV